MKSLEELTDLEKKMVIIGFFCMSDDCGKKDILDRAAASSIESETAHILEDRSGLYSDFQEQS